MHHMDMELNLQILFVQSSIIENFCNYEITMGSVPFTRICVLVMAAFKMMTEMLTQ
jgi:hypothetical protein